MYTEAKMNSAPLLPDGLPQCPSGLLFCEVTRRDELSDKGPYRSQASCYGNRVEGNYYLTLGLRHRLPKPFSSWNRVCSARMFRLQRWPVSNRVNSSKADADDATLIEP
jgi:hypothetical protein